MFRKSPPLWWPEIITWCFLKYNFLCCHCCLHYLCPISFRSWWLVPAGLKWAAVAPGWSGRQSGDCRGRYPGQVRELRLGNQLYADVQRHRPQLETVQTRQHHLGRSELRVPLAPVLSGSGSFWHWEKQLRFQIRGVLWCWERRPERHYRVFWSKWVMSPTVCVIQV